MTITVRAAAKFNLHLGVGPVRDDGFHPLATVYHAIGLYDAVTVRDAEGTKVSAVPKYDDEGDTYVVQVPAKLGKVSVLFEDRPFHHPHLVTNLSTAPGDVGFPCEGGDMAFRSCRGRAGKSSDGPTNTGSAVACQAPRDGRPPLALGGIVPGGSMPAGEVAMQHVRLGRTGLPVSRLCLGTMTFGSQCDEASSVKILERAAGGGITFLDTSDVYPVGGNLDTVGRTEEILGRWLEGRRHDFVVATKCFGAMSARPWDRGLSRKHILDAIEGSLHRLRTDYVDLYQLHHPDPSTPIEESLRALDDVVRAYHAACERHGRAKKLGEDMIWGAGVYLAQSQEEAVRKLEPAHDERYKWFAPFGFVRYADEQGRTWGTPGAPARIPSLRDGVEQKAWFCGPPAQVIDGIKSIANKYPGLESFMIHWAEGLPPKEFKEQLTWFAKDVMPAFKKA